MGGLEECGSNPPGGGGEGGEGEENKKQFNALHLPVVIKMW